MGVDDVAAAARPGNLLRLAIYGDIVVLEGRNVAPPATDTVALAEAGRTFAPQSALVVGCGAGLIPLALARNGTSVTAVDVNPAAAALTRRNAVLNDLEDAITLIAADITTGPALPRYDLLISNPPQLPGVSYEDRNESWVSLANDGGEDGLQFIRWLTEHSANYLKPCGTLMFTLMDIHDISQVAEALRLTGYLVRTERALTKEAGPLSRERFRTIGRAIEAYDVYLIEATLTTGDEQHGV